MMFVNLEGKVGLDVQELDWRDRIKLKGWMEIVLAALSWGFANMEGWWRRLCGDGLDLRIDRLVQLLRLEESIRDGNGWIGGKES